MLSSIFQNIDIFFSGANNLVLTTPRQNDPNDGKLAYAFTPQQYTLAEDITGSPLGAFVLDSRSAGAIANDPSCN